MAHQQLNRAQVGAGFEQVRRIAVPQRVRVDLLLESGARGGDVAGMPDGLVGDGLVYASLARGAGKEIATRLLPPPPAAQLFEQLRRERHIPVPRALTLADVDDHALAVDVFDLDPCRFGPAYSGPIEH